ncbi:zinc finger protein [Stylonychia lemnae]|uniref:Zinc finger protein n=1 Tax=Stylonychia lemnae TaxID=5949 RepID=A0A077ZZ17_STYLE|nr:zinc finger protein [Stylonychia lemnae]|eukprot:CDW74443.1 zinc finger protein [Stylonychia lemnae]
MDQQDNQDILEGNDHQNEHHHSNQQNLNYSNGIGVMQYPYNLQRITPMNDNQNFFIDPNLDLPHPFINFQDNLRRITTRQQSFREIRQNLERSAQQAKEYNETEFEKVMKRSIQCSIPTAITSAVWIGLGISNRDASKIIKYDYNCQTPISTWLIVMGVTYGLQFFYFILLTIILCIKKEKAKPIVQFLSLANLCFVINFQVSWVIYGNTFHYTEDSVKCRINVDDFKTMWILMMVSIAFGYILLFVYAILGCFCILSCCILCSGSSDRDQPSEFIGKIPYLNVVKSLNKKDFKYIEEVNKSMNECAICLAKFQDDDKITELNCDKRHYFHSLCIQSWMKQKLECPLCKKYVGAVKSF